MPISIPISCMRAIMATTALALLVSSSASAQNVAGFGTMANGTLANVMMTAIVKVATTREHVNGVVQTHAGPTQYLPLLNRGELDFANANVVDALLAKQGVESFQSPNPNIRMVSVIMPLAHSLLVRRDSGIKTLADLKGKRMIGEYQGQRTLKILVDSILATAGMTTNDVVVVPTPNVISGLDSLGRGLADAADAALSMPKVQELHAQLPGGVRFLSLVDTPQAVAAMQKIVPPSYIQTAQPSAKEPAVDGPTKLQAYDYVLLTRADEPEEIVYKVVKAMHESKDELVAIHPSFRAFSRDKMAKKVSLDYHPGAIKFYKEAGLWPPKN